MVCTFTLRFRGFWFGQDSLELRRGAEAETKESRNKGVMHVCQINVRKYPASTSKRHHIQILILILYKDEKIVYVSRCSEELMINITCHFPTIRIRHINFDL
jgi:hypothetical protein